MGEVIALPEVPRFSLAERELRWGRVRSLMDHDALDVIVIPRSTGAWDGGNANARYLTGLGGNGAGGAIVFPREGEVTAIVGPVPSREYWLAFQDWVTDIRYAGRNVQVERGGMGASGRRYGGGVVERLQELGVEQGRIGIAGLAGTTRAPDGIVPYGAFTRLREAFPEAELLDATALLDEARVVKSAEEITFLERGLELVERAIETLIDAARPGVSEAEVYIEMLASTVKHGGELPTMLLWSAGNPQPSRNSMMPSQRRLAKGDIIGCEIDGNYGGYRAQVTCNAILGKAPAHYADMFRLQQEALQRCYERLRPGAKMGDFMDICEKAAQGTPYTCRLIMHSRGTGDDAPMIIFGARDPRVVNWPIEENNVFIFKPMVWMGEWEQWVCWGDTVVVTPDGPRRLGKRPPELIEIL